MEKNDKETTCLLTRQPKIGISKTIVNPSIMHETLGPYTRAKKTWRSVIA